MCSMHVTMFNYYSSACKWSKSPKRACSVQPDHRSCTGQSFRFGAVSRIILESFTYFSIKTYIASLHWRRFQSNKGSQLMLLCRKTKTSSLHYTCGPFLSIDSVSTIVVYTFTRFHCRMLLYDLTAHNTITISTS